MTAHALLRVADIVSVDLSVARACGIYDVKGSRIGWGYLSEKDGVVVAETCDEPVILFQEPKTETAASSVYDAHGNLLGSAQTLIGRKNSFRVLLRAGIWRPDRC